MSDDTPPADGPSILVDLERDTLRARGSEATPWLNGLFSIDLRAVAPGRGAFGLLLTKTGKIQTDIDVLARPGELILGVGAGAGETVRAVLDAHLVMEDVELEPATNLAWLRLVGPGAVALANECASDFVAHGAIDWLGLGGAAAVVRRDGIDRVVRRLREGRNPAGAAAPACWTGTAGICCACATGSRCSVGTTVATTTRTRPRSTAAPCPGTKAATWGKRWCACRTCADE